MLFVLSDNGAPVYERIVDAVKQKIFSRELDYGDELPPVRTLAGLLQVNMHTVRHAYRLLAEEGIIVMKVGQRTRIRPRPSAGGVSTQLKTQLLNGWEKLEREAFLHGMRPGQLLELIQNHLAGESK